ncbi:unnamed protein product [Rotaria sp. Silwood2]|nr:unnamed protein product [Rotaria sp. Silwood2]
MTSNTNNIIQIRGQDFAVSNRFVNLKYLASGAYGMVVSAFDTQKLTNVAIKKISPFLSKINCQRTLREIRILQRLKHENIINIIEILKPTSLEQMKDIYLIETLMDTDLSQLITNQNGSKILSDDHILYFTYQLLRGVKYIHSANVGESTTTNVYQSVFEMSTKIPEGLQSVFEVEPQLPLPATMVDDEFISQSERLTTR